MARRRKRHRPVCVADMVFKGGLSVETSGFSGAPAATRRNHLLSSDSSCQNRTEPTRLT